MPKTDTTSKVSTRAAARPLIAPSADFRRQANLSSPAEYKKMHSVSIDTPKSYWKTQALQWLTWRKRFNRVLEWRPPHARWFTGGTLNVSENCIDRHLGSTRENKAALIFEGEPGDTQTLTFRQLHSQVCRTAHVLENSGIKSGDRVAIYMPMIPEAVIAMLACARIGAIHTVIFGGFSPEALKDRLCDSQAKLVITADGGWRRGKVIELKANVDKALAGAEHVKNVIVVKRCGNAIAMQTGRDIWWHEASEAASNQHAARAFDSEHPLFILYTSGSTGKPKGVVHASAGYLLGAVLSARYIFDLKETDRYFCSADIGWVTGHSYLVYGPLANGATVFLYEGAPNHPEPDRFWQMIDRHQITILYTAPTAIRAFMRWGDQYVSRHRLDSLRLLGSVGEPISPEAWTWYHTMIGKGRCPIVDTWWQTETGSIMIAPLPGVTPTKPGSASLPFFGVAAKVVDASGNEVGRNTEGKLVITAPWPAMLHGIWNDAARYEKTYFSEFPGRPSYYFTGDGARQDEDGYFWITGRIDDVLNISGHRIGTAEVESALASHPAVAEAAAVGRPDELKGQSLVIFVTLKNGTSANVLLKEALRSHVGKEIGSLAKPDEVRFAAALPKTRSGKIMRRLLKELAATGEIKGDTTTLEDFSVISALKSDSE